MIEQQGIEVNKQNNGLLRILELTALVFSVITGGSSVGLLVWKGGELAQTVAYHETRLSKIEAAGSPPYSEHMKLDDERNSNAKQRLDHLEKALANLDDLRIQMATIVAKVDSIQKTVEKK